MGATLLQKNKTAFAVAATYASAFGSAVKAGSTLIAVSYYSSNGVPTVSDTLGNVGWTIADRNNTFTGGLNTVVCFVLQNSLAGSCTITLDTHGTAGNGDLFIFEYGGVLSASLDTHNMGTGTNANPSVSLTTSLPNELLFNYFASGAGGNVIDSNYALQEDDAGFLTAGDAIGVTATSYATSNACTSAVWVAGLVSLKPSLSGVSNSLMRMGVGT